MNKIFGMLVRNLDSNPSHANYNDNGTMIPCKQNYSVILFL